MTSDSFKSLIDYALELNGISINRLATTIGVDRPWLQHALVGRRNLGYDNFEKIMNSLTLSEQLNAELREAFAKEHFGEADFDIIKNCLSHLNKMYKYENTFTPPLDFSVNLSNFLEEQLSQACHDDEKSKNFFTALYNIVAEELQKEKPMFYTTYALTIDSVKNFFVNILRSSDVPIDYKHIVFNETSHTEQDVIDIFLRQYELAGYGYNSYYAQHSKGFTSSSPLPYFILTSEAAIFFSKDLQLFIVEKNDAHIGYTKEYFMNNLSHSLPFAFFMRDKEAFKLFTSLNPQITDESSYHHYDLSSNLCMASYLDAEILADSIPDEVEHKDYFVQGIAGFFNFYAQSPMTCTWDNDSLMNFVENDELICDYHNVTFDVFQISPKNKLKLLKKLKQNILEHNSNHFVVRELYMPSYFHINALGHNLVLGFNFKILDADNGKRYISTAVSQNPIIHKHLKNLTEYIIHSSYVYSNSRDYAIAQIDNAIFYYCRKHGFSTDDIM